MHHAGMLSYHAGESSNYLETDSVQFIQGPAIVLTLGPVRECLCYH